MGIGPSLVVRGALVMSLFVASLCLWVIPAVSLEGSTPALAALGASDAVNASGQSSAKDGAVPGSGCGVSASYPQSILQWCALITQYADANDLAPDLVAAVMLQESGGDRLAYSQSGAVGLMQVMPRDGLAANFVCANGPCFASRPTIQELQDPQFNLEYATRMLSSLQSRYGSLREALKAYGPKDVGYYYADKVLAIYDHYQGK